MFFDMLTIIGLLAIVPYAFLPLLFGRELIRVEEDQVDDGHRYSALSSAGRSRDAMPEEFQPEPCQTS